MKKSSKKYAEKRYANTLINEIILILILFIIFSYLAQIFKTELQETFGNSILSMMLYLFIFIIAVVIAPINSEPLIPVASQIWGWFIAGLLTLIGWSVGSFIAFIIARRYKVPLLKKFISLKKITKFEKYIPQNHLFVSVIFLRMTIQVDLLSYILGFMTKMKPVSYFLASLIGLAPLAFTLAYVGELPLIYQSLALSIGVLVLLLGILITLKREKNY